MRAALGVSTAVLLLATAALAAPPATPPGAEPFPKELAKRLEDALAAKGASYEARTRNKHADGTPKYSNRLLLERSPYLQQHAHNPVNWYPWGDEAFETAKRLNRPVLVSIGYSTCHWCHVMEEESFDDPETAKQLNEQFVAVKVDRETRPDIDAIYMSALHALGERGGWPLNVWVTPERKPFFGGTYFPPTDRAGRRSFRSVLATIHEQWTKNPDRFEEFAERLSTAVAESLEASVATESRVPTNDILTRAAELYAERADREWGGLLQKIKFPSTLPVRFLLRYHRRAGDADSLAIATLSLEKMAAGGMWDHVGGGFHRYSTDPRWLVPHFEKMLYDNALLAIAYLEASQVTGRTDFRQTTRDILEYVLREMTAPSGGFYSATDADSKSDHGEMEEGWFFTWTPAEIAAALTPEETAAVVAYYGVTDEGNYEGRNILHAWRPEAQVAKELGIDEATLRTRLDAARPKLYAARAKRSPPLRDDKVLAAWNGLMIQAFAQAGFVLAEPRWVEAADRAASFVVEKMRDDQGRLLRVHQDGTSGGPAFLEDYAFTIAGLLDLHEATGEARWLRTAIELQNVLDRHYADEVGGGYFKTADFHERLLAREKPASDGALPSGNSVALLNLLRLTEFTTRDAHAERAELAFSAFAETLERTPQALSEMLLALDYQLDRTLEIVLVTADGGGPPEELLAELRKQFVPNRTLSRTAEGRDLEELAALSPLVAGRKARGGKPTAYVCENRVCKFPTTDPQVFAKQLRSLERIE